MELSKINYCRIDHLWISSKKWISCLLYRLVSDEEILVVIIIIIIFCKLLWDFAVNLIWLDFLVFWYFLSVLYSFGNYILWFGWESELWTYHSMKLHKTWNIRLLCFGLVFCWVSGYDINSIHYKSNSCLLWFISFYSSVGIFNKMLCSVYALTLFNFFFLFIL